ncbi:MCP four helix bundle domain-containing protein, partial [Nocardioides flavescens]
MDSTQTPAARSALSRFGDLRLAVKILMAVGAAAAVAVIVGVVGLRALGGANDAANDLYEGNVRRLQMTSAMQDGISTMRIQVREALIRQGDEYDAAIAAVDQGYTDYQAAAAEYGEQDLSSQQRSELEALNSAAASYHDVAQEVLPEFAKVNDVAGWTTAFDRDVNQYATVQNDTIGTIIELENADAEKDAKAVAASFGSSRNLVIGVLVLGTALALLLGWLIARALARSVAKVKDVADAMAAGDLSKTAGITTRDEVGTMATSLDAANTSLRQLMTSVTASADGVASA